MTELERRALIGDKGSQRECTEKGIVLACPFCGNDKNTISNWGMWRCWCPNCLAKSEDALTRNDALKAWNTRPAPPIGRCDDCNHRYENEDNEYECEIHNICPDDNFYCKDFEPKEDYCE